MATLEIYDKYSKYGIKNRIITPGEEYDMVREFIDYRKSLFKEKENKKLAVFIETKVNNNYPDIMFVEFNPSVYQNWENKRNELNVNDLKVLDYIIKHRNVTSQKIASHLFLSYKDLLFSLENLYDSNLIERIDRTWKKSSIPFIGVRKIEAVEAKINNWDVVMQQAVLNRLFASQSSVLYKRKSLPNEQILEKLQNLGLGAYIYDNTNFSKCVSPQTNRFPCDYNSLYINEFIGRLITNEEVCV